MIKHVTFIATICVLLFSCSGVSKQEINSLNAKVDSIQKVANAQSETIKSLRDSLSLLAFPADQRLLEIKRLITSEEFAKAKSEISNLRNLFPHSSEAIACKGLDSTISAKEATKKAELERIKALGFKAIPQKSTFTIGYNTITIGKISVGTQFIHDAYDDSWFYNTADRGNKYISAAMSVKSTDKDPNLPQLAVYSISGETMSLVTTFDTEFARWSDYGAYLGNYHDNRNDFAKVSTVQFKIGAEVSDEVLAKPYAIVVAKQNGLARTYDRLANPPYSYVGSIYYPSTLSVEYFEKDYILVKLTNL